jgi:hypothetical protein
MSRHSYDVACLIDKGVAARAVERPGLFESIAGHRRVSFARNEAAHDSMRRGSLRLLPSAERRAAWKSDYERMRESMFFREPPTFERLLDVVGGFEAQFNSEPS